MEFSKACTNVDYILDNLNEEDYLKIPNKLIEIIKLLKEDNYEPQIDIEKPLEEQELTDATKGLIALIYNKYLGTEEEKAKFNEEYNNNSKDNNAYEMKFKKTESILNKTTSMEEYKEKKSFFEKIIGKIRNWFRR